MTSGTMRATGTGMFQYFGAWRSIPEITFRRLLERSTAADDSVRAVTARIIGRVRRDGDGALIELARELDGVTVTSLEVPRARWEAALERTPSPVRAAMERAASNIASVHRAFRPEASEVSPEPGVVVGRRPDPLGRVGIYAPGGRAAYPSSVLMGSVPAKVAGVGETILCSPPASGGNGDPLDVVLAAACIGEVDRVFAIGGAGAIAAMAYGTSTVPRADRIMGPGNAYVAEAKLQLCGVVGIDAPAGPSELLAIVDEAASVDVVARELLAQAEHDPRACVVAVTVGEEVAHRLACAVSREIERQPRRAVIEASLAAQGAIVWVATVGEAVALANEYAAEHVLLALADAERVCSRLRSCGTIFLGQSSSVAFGDYMTGANHVLPTGGLARSYSGLSIADFFRWTTYQRVTRAGAASLASDVTALAYAESLPGHAIAADAWRADARSVT